MRKLLIATLAILLTTAAHAAPLQIEDVLDKLPALDNGVAYDFDRGEVVYTSTLNLVEWKGFTLNGGYTTVDNAIVGASYEVTNLEKLGVDIPILKYVKVEPMVYLGWRSINVQKVNESEFSWGAGVKLLEVNF